MTRSTGDPLLTAARVLVILFNIALIFSLVAIGIGIGVLLTVGRGEIYDRIAAADAPDIAYWVVVGAFVLIALAIALAVRFFAALHEIIVSVDRGEPFDRANAHRLRRMGWLAIAGQLIFIPVGAMGRWLAPYLERLDEEFTLDIGLDPGALLLIAVLFILARVFERGAAMEGDLEGTV